jgi:thiol-disulfide isomerase/thioredoxin
MKKTLLTLVLATLCLFFKANAQTITPLKIGDKIPEALWDLPLSIIQQSDKPHTVTLKSFKGKVIILDFWGRYCSPCIKFLPELDSLKRTYNNQLVIIPVSDFNNAKDLRATLQRHHPTRLNLPMSLTNNVLRKYFPHQLVSHMVWIDATGKVAGITTAEYVNSANVESVINGKPNQWPQKNDFKSLSSGQPILTYSGNKAAPPKPVFYSAFIGNLPGSTPPNGSFTDSLSRVTTTSFYNRTLLSYCEMALDYSTGAALERFKFAVQDLSRFIKPDSLYYDQWSKEHTYCYSISLPASISKARTRQIIQEDLIRWLRIMGINPVKTMNNKYLITDLPANF